MEIRAENLSLRYGEAAALKNVHLSVPSNKVTALIGPSGCGKTSFLRCINRMVDTIPAARFEGRVWVQGQNILMPTTDVVALRMRVGMLFQKPNPFPQSIRQNLLFAPRLHGIVKREDEDALCERVLKQAALFDEVSGRLDDSALDLSGGQQQRLCLARALAVQPKVLLMDEPCSALDPVATEKIEALIRELRGLYTVVIVTHNLAQARRVADQVAFFHMGEMIEQGTATQIFEAPLQAKTRDYVTGRFG